MTTEEQRTERIEAYLKGTMSNEEHVSFDSELAMDQILREEVAMHRKAHRTIDYLNRKELKQKLKSIDAETTSARNGSRMRKLIIRLAVAASIVLVMSLGFMFTTGYFNQSTSLADLSEEFFVPTQPESFRGDNGQMTRSYAEQLVDADLLYQKGDYDSAITEYKRLSLIANTMSDRAEWNLIMSYLMNESHQVQCNNLLEKIVADPTHMYHERALRLQEEL